MKQHDSTTSPESSNLEETTTPSHQRGKRTGRLDNHAPHSRTQGTMRPTTPRVRFQVQPRVTHYREQLLLRLLESPTFEYSLFGITADRGKDKIRPAGLTALSQVDSLDWHTLGPWRWDHRVIMDVTRGRYDAYVLEGRVYTLSTWVALLIARMLHRNVFLWTHGWKRPEQGVRRFVRTTFYKMSSGILVYGRRARDLSIQYGLAPQSVHVVGNSINSKHQLETWKTTPFHGPRRHELTIVVACRLTPRHNITLLLDAIDLLPDPSLVRIVIVGDGSDSPHLRRRASICPATVHFMGAVYDNTQLAEIYSFADVAVSPAASGLNIVQALGFGTAAILPNEDPSAGPEEELVQDGRSGFRFQHGNAADLADKLQHCLKNRELLIQLGSHGRTLVLGTHTAEKQSEAIDSALMALGL